MVGYPGGGSYTSWRNAAGENGFSDPEDGLLQGPWEKFTSWKDMLVTMDDTNESSDNWVSFDDVNGVPSWTPDTWMTEQSMVVNGGSCPYRNTFHY